MKNIFYEDETITEKDLFFICYMVERIARKMNRHNRDIVNRIPADEWRRLISLAGVLHSENPLQVEDDWIREYNITKGDFQFLDIDSYYTEHIPTALQMGKVYQRLILDTMDSTEDYIDAMIRVYNDEICNKLDDYNCGAFYEPSYCIKRAYRQSGF